MKTEFGPGDEPICVAREPWPRGVRVRAAGPNVRSCAGRTRIAVGYATGCYTVVRAVERFAPVKDR